MIKRAYETPAPADGTRMLVDRLWPRGITKEKLHITEWLKNIAPTAELRTWFGHDPAKWTEFKRRYTAELRGNTAAVDELAMYAKKGPLTLVYGAKDTEHNHALVLKEYLENL
jgi:uncharacterized protein YeaO (DUF488 family)